MNWKHRLPEDELTYAALLEWAKGELCVAGVPEAQVDARLLLFHVFSLDMTTFLLRGREPLASGERQKELARFMEMVALRGRRVPLQHILGSAPFMGLAFKVNEDVLIPRQDTEVLAEHALALLRGMCAEEGQGEKAADAAPEVLDLCTGSGCLAVSIKKQMPSVACVATDLSEKALVVARENAEIHAAKIRFLQGDLFAPLQERGFLFDLIVSNPPYIPSGEIGELAPEVREHDPRLALDGGEDGLALYRRIAREAPLYLKDGGHLCLEIGFDQGKAVSALLEEAGFTGIRILRDLAGLDRVVEGIRPVERAK